MEENQYSQTALKTACYRAYHALCDNPKIFEDPLAYVLVGEKEFAFFREQMAAGLKEAAPELAASLADDSAILAFMMQALAAPTLTFSRARYAEDRLMEAARHGVEQYVILGAGLESFVFRRPEWAKNLEVLEVDHPATQAFKRRRLAELGWDKAEGVHYIPVDFTRENLSAALIKSAYNPAKPGFFSWMGVTYYLPRETVFETLQSVTRTAAPGSRIVFDYLDSEAFIPNKAAQRVQVLLMMARGVGESMNMGLEPSTLEAELARAGLKLVEDLSPRDVQQFYFQDRTDNYYACEHAHLAYAVKQ